MTIIEGPALLERAPDFHSVYVRCSLDWDSYDLPRESDTRAAQIFERTRAVFPDAQAVELHPNTRPYRAFYEALGYSLKRISTPAYQIRRILERGFYRSINPYVDAYMLVELTQNVSIHSYASEAIQGDLTCDLLEGSMPMVLLNGEEHTTRPGGLVLFDDAGAIYTVAKGDCRRTAVDQETSSVLFRIAGAPGIDQRVLSHAADTLLSLFGNGERVPVRRSISESGC